MRASRPGRQRTRWSMNKLATRVVALLVGATIMVERLTALTKSVTALVDAETALVHALRSLLAALH